MAKRRIVSFDLDMTLLDHSVYEIPDSALLAIEKLRERGDIIVIGSGRNMDNTDSKKFSDLVGTDALIHMNGTRVTVGEEVLFEHFFDKNLLRRLVDFCLPRRYGIGVTLNDRNYYFNADIVDTFDEIRWGMRFRKFYAPEEIFNLPIRTLAYIGNKEGALDIEAHFPELHLPMFAGYIGADVIEKGFSKADGLKVLCEHFGVDIEDTIAFGDSMNDKEIIEVAGIGIAMGNAIEELKAVANHVTEDIGKDGIYVACERLGLFE